MGEKGPERTRRLSREGVSVYQVFEPAQFDVPTVLLDLQSSRDDVAEVRLSVELIEDLRIERVGFHPEYGAEHWSVTGNSLLYQRSIDPEEDIRTMYAVDALPQEAAETLMDCLEITSVRERSAEEDRVDTGGGPDDDEDESAVKIEEGMISIDPDHEIHSPGSASGLASYSTTTLVSELEDRASGDGLPREVKRRLGLLFNEVMGRDPFTVDLRVAHLQQRLSEVEAIMGAMEQAAEPYGSPPALIEALEVDRSELLERLDMIETEHEASDRTLGELDRGLHELEADLGALEQEHTGEVEAVADRLETIEADLREVKSDQQAIIAELSDLTEWRETLRDNLSTL